MTKEEILVMEAGLELDRLVEEVVFNHKEAKIIEVYGSVWVGETPSPFYSTDISAAWQVVDKMFGLGYAMSLLHLSSEFYPEYWYCDFRPKDSSVPPRYEWVDHQMAAPVVICKAALLAKLEVSGANTK